MMLPRKKYLDLENYTSFKIFSDVIRSHSWYLGRYRDLRNRKSRNNLTYYTTSSASGQDEPNLALRLATRAGKMELN